jgi:hypothetical protein
VTRQSERRWSAAEDAAAQRIAQVREEPGRDVDMRGVGRGRERDVERDVDRDAGRAIRGHTAF